jgi:hypothetical protein
MRLQPIVTACLLAGLTLLFYGFRLTAAPVAAEESAFNQASQTVSAGATPLFFHLRDEHWLQPLAVYANRVMRGAGGDDMAGRIASALLGSANVGLVFLIAQLVTGRTWIGILAALLLIATPAHWSLAQRGTDAIFPVPLVLLWLWNAIVFLKRDSMQSLAMSAAPLGVFVYSHPTGPLTALFLWTLTLVVARRRNRVRLFTATLVFAAAWLPAAWWFFRHPETYADTFGRWFIFAAHARDPIAGLQAQINSNTLGVRASLYWGFWDPSWLFFAAKDTAAPMLLISLPLIVLGIVGCLRQADRSVGAIVLGGALLVPLTGATLGLPHYLPDAAAVLSILALVSGFGVDYLAGLVRPRRSLEDDEHTAAAEGWDSDHLMPRS